MPRFNRNLVFNLLIAFALIVLGAVSIWAKTRLISVVMVALGIALMISGFVELIRFFIPGIHHHHGDYNGLFRSLLSIVASVILIWYQGVPQWLMVVLFGGYMPVSYTHLSSSETSIIFSLLLICIRSAAS